jgi:hypothetical protein
MPHIGASKLARDGHHRMSDLGGRPVNRFTVAARALRQCARTSDWMVRAGLMEKIMDRTGHNTEVCELTESELDKVSGAEDKLDPVAAWYRALGRLGLPLPPQGGAVGDTLNCL